MADVLYFPDGGHEAILGNRRDALRRVLDERLGRDTAELFDSVLKEVEDELEELYTSGKGGDDYEKISDGYYNTLVDVRNELSEALRKPRLNRKDIEAIFGDLNRNL